jgi:P-type Ca2+ transporter type 2C
MAESIASTTDKAQLASIHTLSVSKALSVLNSGPEGLSQEEVKKRLQHYGQNIITEVKGKPLWIRFLENFTHLLAILLWVGGIVALVAGMPQLAIAIWLVNVINGIFSFGQEYKAEKATEALKKLLPMYARVLRKGQEERILAENLVPGDVILLEEGDRISADARLIEENEIRVDQSTLSGESHPVRKTSSAILREDLTRIELSNLIYSGTMVASGTGRAVAFATGMETEFGKIAHLTQTVGEELSPLQKEMGRVTKTISLLAMGIGVLFFIAGILLAKSHPVTAFISALGMTVAFLPEGLPPMVTLSLAMGVQRMARRGALIKRLSSVETLGSATVICTDKTGTLTQNEMTVREIWLPGHKLEVTGVGYAPEGKILNDGRPAFTPVARDARDGDLIQLFVAAGLCNNARLLPPGNEHPQWTILGDPTEASLVVVATKGGVDLVAENRRIPRIREIPFNSRRKRMSTIHQDGKGRLVYVKGAPKEVLALCSHLWRDGNTVELDDNLKDEITAANDSLARDGLRVLAFARRILPEGRLEYTSEVIEQNLTFLGLMAMMDPPRPEVSDAVKKCYTAGIRIIMITGDYGLTAESIARRIGIVKSRNPRIITGVELDSLDEAALREALKEEVIFARVAPENKLRLVTTLKEMGEVVAVTGDGVNDAPALKKADIGVAMGIAGTDVAREAADMILTDDNFASIIHAIEEGRAVYANIRKFIKYVFNSNLAEAMPFMVSILSGGLIPLGLTVMEVLAIDLGTDMMPAIGLGAEPPEPGVMERPPRSQKEPLLNTSLIALALLFFGLMESVASMSAYFFLNWRHGWPSVPLAQPGTEIYGMVTAITLAGVVATQVGSVFACRTDRRSIFKVGFTTNRLVLYGIAGELILLVLLVYVPFLQGIFSTGPLDWIDWLYVFAWTPVIFLADELRKAYLRRLEQRTRQRPTV